MVLRPLGKGNYFQLADWLKGRQVTSLGLHSTPSELIGYLHEINQTETNSEKWLIGVQEDEKVGLVAGFTNNAVRKNSTNLVIYFEETCNILFLLHAGLACLVEAFEAQKLNKINLEIQEGDSGTLRIAKLLGFTKEGVFRQHFIEEHRTLDVLHLGIVASEWEGVKEGVQERIHQLEIQKGLWSKKYSIQILTDQSSWMLPSVQQFADKLIAGGHTCKVSFKASDAIKADFCFCLSFGQLLSEKVRSLYKNTLVVHGSDLPKGRGWSPLTWQILAGQSRLPLTLFEAVESVDAGKIYLQCWIELDGTELVGDWQGKIADSSLELCWSWLENYPSILERGRQQIGEPTYYPRRKGEDSKLNVDNSLREQFELLRVVDNDRYPAFFEIRNSRYYLKIYRDCE